MRIIETSSGFSGSIAVTLSDALKSLDGASFYAALVGVNDPVPIASSGDWQEVESEGTSRAANLAVVVGQDTAPGDYNLVVDVRSGGTHDPVWVLEPRGDRRALIRVK